MKKGITTKDQIYDFQPYIDVDNKKIKGNYNDKG